MANRAGPSSGDDRRSDPRWSGQETLNTMDSGIGYTQDLYGPAHAQLVGCKRRADDD